MDDHFILEIEDSIPLELCNQIIERFERSDKKEYSKLGKGRDTEGYVNLNIRNSQEIHITSCQEWEDIDKKLFKCLNRGFEQYKNELHNYLLNRGCNSKNVFPLIFGSNLHDNGYTVLRVEKQSGFIWHHDTPFDDRVIMCIWYLNTLEPGNAGVTEFINGRKIVPKAGKLLIFPATWQNLHRGVKLQNEYKYMCTAHMARSP